VEPVKWISTFIKIMDTEKIQIQHFENGRIVVSNAEQITIFDSQGNELPSRKKFTLCGCGKSEGKPFCDGAHNKN
jgi:CDGSH-type Zn-finger protein